MTEAYKEKKYFGMAIDPIHVGTGGYRLGRVDNTIVKDKATGLPIIPGSTIEGVTRTYAAYKLMESQSSIKDNKREYLNCAGKDTDNKTQCGECEICVTFGYSNRDSSLHGMAQFSDAKILFFPVYSFKGPVWVTSPSALKEIGIVETEPSENKIRTSVVDESENLNLGWLYLENEGDSNLNGNDELEYIPDEIKTRAVIVSDELLSKIVKSNLEVRTSVSIDPQTGAAEKGALFTYEAIPRTTILQWDVIYNNPEMFPSISKDVIPELKRNGLIFKKNGAKINPVEEGMKLYEFLGIGGMGTRGFGRMNVFNLGGK